jgi:Flp pilus assembly protein TadD
MRKLFLAWPLLFFCLLTNLEARAQTDTAPTPQQTSPTEEKLNETTDDRAVGEKVSTEAAAGAAANEHSEEAAGYYRLCRKHMEEEQVEDALADCNRAVKLRPDYAQAFYTLGKLYQHANRTDDAEAAFRRAVELQPDNAAALMELGSVYTDAGRPADAVELLQHAIRLRLGIIPQKG